MWLIMRWHQQQHCVKHPEEVEHLLTIARARQALTATAPLSPAAPPSSPALALVFNAFVWGVSWWPFRELQAHGLHPLWATALIYVARLAVIVALRPQAVARLRARPALLGC